VTGGGRTVNAFIQFAWTSQINAILPPTLRPAPCRCASHTTVRPAHRRAPEWFRATSASSALRWTRSRHRAELHLWNNTPLNNAATTARRGDVVIIWATGLGPVTIADNVAPSGAQPNIAGALQVTIGGVVAPLVGASRSGQFPGWIRSQ